MCGLQAHVSKVLKYSVHSLVCCLTPPQAGVIGTVDSFVGSFDVSSQTLGCTAVWVGTHTSGLPSLKEGEGPGFPCMHTYLLGSSGACPRTGNCRIPSWGWLQYPFLYETLHLHVNVLAYTLTSSSHYFKTPNVH